MTVIPPPDPRSLGRGAISGGWVQNYGYIAESERYRYYLRCNPVRGDYNVYLTCQAKEYDTTRGTGNDEC